MKSEPISRTPAQAERIGDALIFLAYLGPLILSDRQRLDNVDLALALLNDRRLMPIWWDQLQPEQQLAALQMVAMPPKGSALVMPRWKYMHPKTQDAFAFRVRQKIRGSLQIAAGSLTSEQPAAPAKGRGGAA